MMDSSFGEQRLCNIRSNTSISNHLPLNPLKTDANAFYGKIIPIAYTTYEIKHGTFFSNARGKILDTAILKNV